MSEISSNKSGKFINKSFKFSSIYFLLQWFFCCTTGLIFSPCWNSLSQWFKDHEISGESKLVNLMTSREWLQQYTILTLIVYIVTLARVRPCHFIVLRLCLLSYVTWKMYWTNFSLSFCGLICVCVQGLCELSQYCLCILLVSCLFSCYSL